MSISLESMTIEQLKALCKERGIAGYSAPLKSGGKAGLVEFIEKALEMEAEEEPVSSEAGNETVTKILHGKCDSSVGEGPVASGAGGVEEPVSTLGEILDDFGFTPSVYSASQERQFNTPTENYKGWDICLEIPNGGIVACIIIRERDAFHFPVGDTDGLWFHFDYLDQKGVIAHAKRAIDAVNEAGGIEGPVSSIDASQCLKIGGKVKIHCNDPFIDGQQGVLLDVGDKGIARVQLNDGEYISSLTNLTSVAEVEVKPVGESAKDSLWKSLNTLLVEIHLAAHRISPGIGESAVLASVTTLLDFLRNDEKKIDFAARYAASLGTDTSEIDNYLEKASFTKTRCRFGPKELPSFQFEKIQNIQYIEDSLDPQEIHLVVLAKCETLYFCGYANLLTQKAFLACGEELAISLKFANLKILTKGQTVREAFERK